MELPEAEVNFLRRIPRWDGYLAGEDGRIYSVRRRLSPSPRILKGGLGGSGYLQSVFCRNDGTKFNRMFHVLITEAFYGPRPEGTEASHKNGNSLDNRPENLCWETREENLARKKLHGTHDEGLTNSRSAMTPKKIAQVRDLIGAGETNAAIALQVGVSKTTISRIRSGRRYSSV